MSGGPNRRLRFNGLTYLQRKAIYLLLAFIDNEEKVSEQLGISNSTLKGWMNEPAFMEALENRMKALEKSNAKDRARQNKIISEAVYEELQERIVSQKSLKKLSTMQLLRALVKLNHEVRVDTPGEVTSKSEVKHEHKHQVEFMDDIAERYQKNKEAGSPTLKLVAMPKKKKEASNG